MIRLFLLLSLAGLNGLLTGQSLEPTLIGSSGAEAVDPSFGTLDWSVGEMLVSTFDPAGAGPVLTQGFHQVFVSITTATEEEFEPGNTVLSPVVYPNPSGDWVNMQATEPMRVRVLDLLGITLIPFGESADFQTINLGKLYSGTYWLEVAGANGKTSRIFKLQIIH